MNNKLDVMGMNLDICYVKDIIDRIYQDWCTPGFYTYGIVNMRMLRDSKEENRLVKYLKGLDIPIINDEEVLRAAGIEDERMVREVKEHEFFFQILACAQKDSNSVFLLAETEKEIEDFAEFLRENYPEIQILGMDFLHIDEEDYIDGIINKINSLSPEIVLTCSKGLLPEIMIPEHRQKINAHMWLSLGCHPKMKEIPIVRKGLLGKLLDKSGLTQRIWDYKSMRV